MNIILLLLMKTDFVDSYMRAKILKRLKYLDLGENCQIYSNVGFGSEPYLVSIGNNVRITNGVRFITHDGAVWVLRNLGYGSNLDKFGKINVGNNVFIGLNSIILSNVNIGDNVIIGAGSIVTKNCESGSVYAGVPARRICNLEDYFNRSVEYFYPTKQYSKRSKREFLLRIFK